MLGGQGSIRMCALALPALLLAAAAPTAARADQRYSSGGVSARVTPNEVVLGNQLAQRSWARKGFRTEEIVDRRGAGRRAAGERRDFALTVAGVDLGSDAFDATSVSVRTLARGGLRVTMSLAPSLAPSLAAPPLRVTRVAEAYPGVAGFRTQTTVESPIPLVLSRARLEEAGV